MAHEPSWDSIFDPDPTPDSSTPSVTQVAEPAPTSRREAREGEARRRGGGNGSGSAGGARAGSRPSKRGLLWLKIALPLVLVIGAAGGVAAFGWVNYNEQVRELLGIPLAIDYEGTGNGVEAIVTVRLGDLGSDVATELHDAGVTMTYDAFYDLLVAQADNVNFVPGNFSLQKEMSAQSALDALLDPANKITDRVLLREGVTLPTALELISETTSIPLAELQAAAADLPSFGLPAEAPSLEGYLFPATYELDGTETAQEILQRLVTEMFARLDSAGVAVEDRHRVLTLAALIQKEGGPEVDFAKVSRVFTNRLNDGILLQSDATVSYGAGSTSIFTTDAERADDSNPYNTYVHPGLPIGPISAPGAAAIDAALNPVDGPWLFFVLVNGETGETTFSTTVDEHDAAVEVWQRWLRDHPEWDTGE
ncbi:endolytic transglycosylase MltG [Salinibacterium sp.]|uniref:endolytic transglycosylase MltG n=1 Tax=Salinibacterium sp. TaxID=1915057 RepID=UPI00286CB2CB|nr:endolytic transglycosylase MltG [Salinibacterium sp.]